MASAAILSAVARTSIIEKLEPPDKFGVPVQIFVRKMSGIRHKSLCHPENKPHFNYAASKPTIHSPTRWSYTKGFDCIRHHSWGFSHICNKQRQHNILPIFCFSIMFQVRRCKYQAVWCSSLATCAALLPTVLDAFDFTLYQAKLEVLHSWCLDIEQTNLSCFC